MAGKEERREEGGGQLVEIEEREVCWMERVAEKEDPVDLVQEDP